MFPNAVGVVVMAMAPLAFREAAHTNNVIVHQFLVGGFTRNVTSADRDLEQDSPGQVLKHACRLLSASKERCVTRCSPCLLFFVAVPALLLMTFCVPGPFQASLHVPSPLSVRGVPGFILEAPMWTPFSRQRQHHVDIKVTAKGATQEPQELKQ